MPKLTLNADKEVIESAKRLAKQRGVSVSAMFIQFVRMLGSKRSGRRRPAPITRRVRGLAKAPPNKSDRELFEEAVAAKARR